MIGGQDVRPRSTEGFGAGPIDEGGCLGGGSRPVRVIGTQE